MAIIKANTVLSEVLQEHVILLPLLNRFGIRLGLKDKKVSDICNEHNIDTDFFVYVANNYLQPSFIGRAQLSPRNIKMIVDYLERTNIYYLRAQLPNVEVHLKPFINRSSKDNSSLKIIERFMSELKEALEQNIAEDTEHNIPRYRFLADELGEKVSKITLEHEESEESTEMARTEALVADIKMVMIQHLTGDYDDNLCYAVLFALSTLENDLACNNRLRQRVFLPVLTSMEDEYRKTSDGKEKGKGK